MKRTPKHHGLTLLEVVLALAILAIAFGILAQLSGLGMRAAREARQLTRGQIYCESIMAEMTSGATSPSQSQGSVPQDPNWTYETALEAADVNGMVRLIVVVQRADDLGIGSRVQLVRLIRDPDLPFPEEEEADETTSSYRRSFSMKAKEYWI